MDAFVSVRPVKSISVIIALFRLTFGPTIYPLVVTTYGAFSGLRGNPCIPPEDTL